MDYEEYRRRIEEILDRKFLYANAPLPPPIEKNKRGRRRKTVI